MNSPHPKTMLGILIATLCLTATVWAGPIDSELESAGKNADALKGFFETATKDHGPLGARAAIFLIKGMPVTDRRKLDHDFLVENLTLALKAREEFPWAKEVPEELFFNDVLPYASLDETREEWRNDFYGKAEKIVAGCKTTTQAAQALNREFFNVIDVHYNTQRKRPNQSPSESIDLNRATCTGLAIILVDACRSVGVPARIAGTALWTNKRGNHTWVEVWDNGKWFYTGADEHDAAGLDRGWFTSDASKAIADNWKHAIWATSWKKTETHFPMVWNLADHSVAAVNVTDRYAKKSDSSKDKVTVHFRLFEKKGGKRLALPMEIQDADGRIAGTVTTKAGQADLNDMPSLELGANKQFTATITREGESRSVEFTSGSGKEATVEWNWSTLEPTKEATSDSKITEIDQWLKLLLEERHLSAPTSALTKEEAAEGLEHMWDVVRNEQAAERADEMKAKVVRTAGKEMKYLERTFGKAKDGERSLWISMHGGGGAPKQVNDQQWRNQIRLYAPKEGIVVAPRAPTDNWNLWHERHIDDLFDRLIENYVVCRGVSPDEIYLMGYSAGGDGVYQLAPRMADRFAAASMMAGHPNDASPFGLRNLPFMIFVGGRDAAYNRNKVAAEWKVKLDDLHSADPKGYEHKVTIYKDFGHWMNGRDTEALPWMSQRIRAAWPRQIVWRQSNRTHDRFYWLSVPKEQAKGGQEIRAKVDGQKISLVVKAKGLKEVTLRLNDALLDLDQPVKVTVNGNSVFSGKVERSAEALWKSLQERLDPRTAASSELTVTW